MPGCRSSTLHVRNLAAVHLAGGDYVVARDADNRLRDRHWVCIQRCAFSVVMGTSPPPGREEGWGFFFPHAGELVALTGRRPVLPCVRSASFTHSQSAVLGPIETVGDTAHTRARVEHEPDSLRLTSLPAG
jgi:hypothetical protein